MAQNIFGFQGVNTPLENLTNGRYSVADYTTLKETTNARLTKLEKNQTYPIDATFYGKLSVAPSNALPGDLNVSGGGTFGQSINVGAAITVGGGILFGDGSLQTTANGGDVYTQLAYNTTGGEIFTLTNQTKKQYFIYLLGNQTCEIDISNFFPINFADKVQFLTIVKVGVANGDYAVTISGLPVDYDVYLKTSIVTSGSFTMPVGVMTWTLMQRGNAPNAYAGQYVLINQV